MDLKYLNAINILVSAKIGVLQKIADAFDGNFERAWHSKSLKRFLATNRNLSRRSGNSFVSADEQNFVPRSLATTDINPDKEWEKLAKENIEIITILDKSYPKPLKHIADPPFLLYVKGDKKVLKSDCLAVVGTRNLTEYGKRAVSLIVEPLAQAGLTIVSGLAMGIDGLAHRAAVKMNAPTIAVLGGGLNNQSIVLENRSLAKEIIKNGAVITEYPLTASGNKMSFPQRNRIISGLSKGVLVIEADEKSGSLITAKSALDQNRDVFAVPGSIFSSKSKGPNQLIAAGAKAVTEASAILTEYNIDSSVRQLAFPPAGGPANQLEKEVLKIMENPPAGGAISLNEIIRASQKAAPEIISCLMNMELENKIINLGNNRFALSN